MITVKSNLKKIGNAWLKGWLTKKHSARLIMLTLAALPGVKAQTFATLHSFTYSDGSGPVGLAMSGNRLYVTAQNGGSWGTGTLSAIQTDGLDFSSLYCFSSLDPNTCVNGDGAYPFGGLVASDGTLYGTVTYGGSSGSGTLSAIQINGTAFTNLYNFSAVDPDTGSNDDGAYPGASLILSGNILYGTAQCGGSSGSGTVFKINNDGSGFSCLYSFSSTDPDTGANADGACPSGSLILSGNVLYGTTYEGGSSGNGTLFKIGTDGMGFAILHSFTATHSPLAGSFSGPVNEDGACPSAGLILSNKTLYGTASRGGGSGNGTVFAVKTDGTSFVNLHSFTGPDGSVPTGNLILSGNILYGTASHGGSSGNGAVFAFNSNGTSFANLHVFTALNSNSSTNSDGANPSGLILSGGMLYGTAAGGGSSRGGTVFSLSFASNINPLVSGSAPQLTMTCSETSVVLSWPVTATGFTLQSTTNLVAPVIWTAMNGQFNVTNQMSGQQKYYRLIK